MCTEYATATGKVALLILLCLASVSACGGAARSTPRTAPVESAARPSESCEPGAAAFNRRDFAAAAAAFDQCIQANPADAYTYYRAALSYYQINRADLMVTRFESFVRLAPDAPERPEVESILRTARARP